MFFLSLGGRGTLLLINPALKSKLATQLNFRALSDAFNISAVNIGPT